MIINKVRNTKRGIKYGLINRIFSLVLPFCVQAVMIRTLGIEYVGLKGLFSSILSILSLMELGFGSAIAYSMYKPIASDDTDALSALLNYFKKAYRVVGFAILALGFAITPFIKYLIKDSYPAEINIYILFILYLLNTVISYWCFAYKTSILNAYQRTDILSKISTIITIAVSVLQILILLLFKNFYFFLIVSIVGVIFNNLMVSRCVDRMFPEIKCVGKLSYTARSDIRKKIAGAFISKVCYTTRYSFDAVFISIFCGLTQTAMYTNYFAVIAALNGFNGIILNSLLAGVGNNIVLYNKEKNLEDMLRIDSLYLLIGGWMTVCLIYLYQPFMTLWAGKEYLLPVSTMILFPIYFYVKKMTEIRGVYASAAGLFWEDKNRNIIEAIANIILNYLLVRSFGVFGVMLATLLTFCTFGYFGSTHIIFKHYFKCSPKQYFMRHAKLLLVLIFVALITGIVCELGKFDSTILILLYRLLICLTLTPLLYWVVVRKFNDYETLKHWVLNMLKGNMINSTHQNLI